VKLKKRNRQKKSAQPVELGPVLAEGGEGRIHDIVGRPAFVAKVYHDPPTREKAAKLAALVEVSTKKLLAVSAWPVELLREKPGGPPIGVVMPRVAEHKDIHLLYGPRSRLAEFPLAGWPFLIRTAANLARAFAVVHAHGHVIGDVNDRVALVSDRACVRLIDCDGFQIQHGGRTYPCDVGVLTHQPPEFQGVATFRALKRTVNHDGFGLAVLVFQLLFMARHPFSGDYGKAGDMPLERAIRECRFVYGSKAAERGMQPPPAAVDLSAVTRDVARLFEQAFSPSGVKGERPSAMQWAVALEELERLVQRCRTNPCHAYLKGHSCAFCSIDRQTDRALFHLPLAASSGRPKPVAVHLPDVWKEISAIPAPGSAPELPPALTSFERMRVEDARKRSLRVAIRVGTVLVALALAWPTGGLSLALLLLLPAANAGRHRPPGGSALAARTRGFVRRWNEQASERVFAQRLAELKRARTELEGLDEEHARGLAELDAKRRQHQLDAFLVKQRIADAELHALNRTAKAVLESFGIETADEVSAASLARVKTLSEAARQALLAWRAKHEARFVFDPTRGVDPKVQAELERRTQKRRADLVQKLIDGPARLRHTADQVVAARAQMEKEMQPLVREIEKAQKR
jgi:DNA-binding helix-hairpin-helix protein with protein kinase domain